MKKVMEKNDPYRYFTSQELRDIMTLDNPDYSATQVRRNIFILIIYISIVVFLKLFLPIFFYNYNLETFSNPSSYPLGPTRRNACLPTAHNPPAQQPHRLVTPKKRKK